MLSAFARGGTLLGRTWRCAGGLLPHYRQERREVGSSIDQPVGNGVSAQTKDSQKSLPVAPSPEECCGTGCSDCTYLKYAEDLVEYYKDGGAVALQEVDKIADPSVRVFVKTEIKYYLALDQDVRDIIKASREESQKAKTDLQE